MKKLLYLSIIGACLSITLALASCRPDAVDNSNPAHSVEPEESSSVSYSVEVNDDNHTAHQAPNDYNDTSDDEYTSSSDDDYNALNDSANIDNETESTIDFEDPEDPEDSEGDNASARIDDSYAAPMNESDIEAAFVFVSEEVKKSFDESPYLIEYEEIDGYNLAMKVGYYDRTAKTVTVNQLTYNLHFERNGIWTVSSVINDGPASIDEYDIDVLQDGTMTIERKNNMNDSVSSSIQD